MINKLETALKNVEIQIKSKNYDLADEFYWDAVVEYFSMGNPEREEYFDTMFKFSQILK